MSLHKLSVGRAARTRQVAAHDATHTVRAGGLATYCEERRESPGRWFGSGLAALGIEPGTIVTEEQTRALFAHGRHPNAAATADELTRVAS